ncbi:MAG: DUF1080 domain-containing protein [Planctomycetes bacterium]|nr:DUF1080 domain-containing protein [Planctomycetota bacterium]
MPRFTAAIVVAACLSALAATAAARNPAYTDPAATDADFPFQGEYVGTVKHEAGDARYGVQVVALGDGKFSAVAYPGGLPGDGWQGTDKITGAGVREGELVRIEGVDLAGTKRRGEIRGGGLVVLDDAGQAIATLPKVERKSPTLGEKPPAAAIVICDGPGPVDENETLENPKISDDGFLMQGVATKRDFGDAVWHVEFRLPYQPKDRGQGRGNSGAYFQGRYEVQMLDSFGLKGENNECGGVYSVAAPRVNMCLPPLTWQTYDVEVTSPTFEGDKKVANARLTVRHNGVVVHDNVEVAQVTPAGRDGPDKKVGPLYLQDHGNPVRYRNIWVVPKP